MTARTDSELVALDMLASSVRTASALACPIHTAVPDPCHGDGHGDAKRAAKELAGVTGRAMKGIIGLQSRYDKLDHRPALPERAHALLSANFLDKVAEHKTAIALRQYGDLLGRIKAQRSQGGPAVHLVAEKDGNQIKLYEEYQPDHHTKVGETGVDLAGVEDLWVHQPQQNASNMPDVYMLAPTIVGQSPPPHTVTITWLGPHNVDVTSTTGGGAPVTWTRTDFLNRAGDTVIGWVFTSPPLAVVNHIVEFDVTLALPNQSETYTVLLHGAAADDDELPPPVLAPTPIPSPPPPPPIPDWTPNDLIVGVGLWRGLGGLITGPFEREQIGVPFADLLVDVAVTVDKILSDYGGPIEPVAAAMREFIRS